MTRVEAIYERGVFRPVGPVDLDEGDKVEISISPLGEKDPARDFSDIAEETGIEDLATNIDHYLYGLPKQK